MDTYTLRQPIGVYAGITPFNFPAMIPLWMFPMAIVCGNTFVLKLSEQDPLSTMELVELAMQAGIPPGVLNVVPEARTWSMRSARVPTSRRFPSSARPPSAPTSITSRASTGKRVQSMMGAKNHAVVLPDANKEQTLNALAGARASLRRSGPALHGDLGPYRKQVMQFYTQTKTGTAIWFDDATVNDGMNTTIALR